MPQVADDTRQDTSAPAPRATRNAAPSPKASPQAARPTAASSASTTTQQQAPAPSATLHQAEAPPASPGDDLLHDLPEGGFDTAEEIERAAAAADAAQSTPQAKAEARAVEARAEASGEAPAELAKAVESLLKDTTGADGPSAPGGEGVVGIETLDHKIAGLAEDIMAGEFAGEKEGEAGSGVDAMAIGGMPPPPPLIRPVSPAAPAASAPSLAEASGSAARSQPKPSPSKKEPIPGEAENAPPRPPRPSVTQKAAELCCTHLHLACSLASKPVERQPKHVRDAIGWLALVNVFFALMVWVYVWFLRPATPPPPPPLPTAAKAQADEKSRGDGAGGGGKAGSGDKSKSKDKGRSGGH